MLSISVFQAAGIGDLGMHKPSHLPNYPVHQTMNVFMNGLPPYFSAIRPLMSTPMLHNMLPGPASVAAASHRFLTMGGIGGGLGNPLLPLPGLPGLPQPAQMDMSHGNLMSSMPFGGGMKIPLKVPEVPIRSTGGVQIEEIEDTSVPQDLSTKSPATVSSEAEVTGFSIRRNEVSSPKINRENRVENGVVNGLENGAESDCASSPEPVTENGYQTDETRSSATPIEIKPSSQSETMNLSTKAIADYCTAYCQHAKKLRLLRKSVVHMLSVLTPGLNMENGLDYDSDAVDELLHEVIYSNMDDVLDGKD